MVNRARTLGRFASQGYKRNRWGRRLNWGRSLRPHSCHLQDVHSGMGNGNGGAGSGRWADSETFVREIRAVRLLVSFAVAWALCIGAGLAVAAQESAPPRLIGATQPLPHDGTY